MTQNIYNRKYLKSKRSYLRKNLTAAEIVLWKYLSRSKLDGRKFRRQHSIGNYIVDFYCPSERLAVELDGSDHYTSHGELADLKRDNYLKSLNINVVRFENRDIFNNCEAVLEEIRRNFKENL